MRPSHTSRHIAALVGLVALSSVSPSTAFAGPWVKELGQVYAKTSASVFSSDVAFDTQGNQIDPGFTYSNQTYALYAEVGLLEFLAFQINAPIILSVNELNERVRVRNDGLGDLEVALQAQLYDEGPCPVSARLAGRVPMYEGIVSDGAVPGTSGVEPSADDPQGLALRFAPAIGDGSIDIVPTVSFGCSLHPVPMWFGVEAGPMFRLRGFGTSMIYSADVGGYVIPETLALTARVAGQQRLQDAERPTKSFLNLGGGAILKLPWSLALEANVSYIPGGAFVAQGWTLGLGVSYDGRLFPE